MDNDTWNGGNCAVHYEGPWWHDNCFHANFNARHAYWRIGTSTSTSVRNFNNVEMKNTTKEVHSNCKQQLLPMNINLH